MQNAGMLAAAGAALSMVAVAPASAQIVLDLQMLNHPDAQQDPPPYGLRLDNLFLQGPSAGAVIGGVGGVTSFSFDPGQGADMRITVEDLGSSFVINISGQAYGGTDAGGTYGFGEGLYQIDFSYTVNVSEVLGPDGGFVSDPGTTVNQGTITSLGNADVAAGTAWTFYQQIEGSGRKFELLRDEHRLGSFPAAAALDPYVGRAWVTYDATGQDVAGTQDWLFTAVPAPSSLGVLALAAAATRRRR